MGQGEARRAPCLPAPLAKGRGVRVDSGARAALAGDTREAAQRLLGATLRRGAVALRVTETEAYVSAAALGGREDTANHARMGRTARNAPMFGEPGHGYIYLCYGMHRMLNVVTEPHGRGAAVLVRAAEVLEGDDVVVARRSAGRPTAATPAARGLLAGPGKVGQALALEVAHSGQDLLAAAGDVGGGALGDALQLELTATPLARSDMLCGPRVGIGYASAEDVRAPWRYACADAARRGHVSAPLKTLAPLAEAPGSLALRAVGRARKRRRAE